MDKKKLNLEETVGWLVDVATGVKIEFEVETAAELEALKVEANIGKYIYDKTNHLLYVITKDGDDLATTNLGTWPKAGPQGAVGPAGSSPTIAISNNSTWVVNGVDTGKPSRGAQGEQGPTGIPGRGVDNMLSISAENYTPITTAGATYTLVSSSADVDYGTSGSKTINLKIKVPTSPDVTNYYTKTQVDNKVSDAVTTAEAYTDESVTGLVTQSEVDDAISDHNTDADAHTVLFDAKQDLLTTDSSIDISNNTIGVNVGTGLFKDANGIRLNNASQNVVDSGITAAKVSTYDGYASQISSKSTVTGQNDGTNWTQLTIDGTTKAIPVGGGGGTVTGAKLGGTSGTQATVDANGNIIIPFAANNVLGLVKPYSGYFIGSSGGFLYCYGATYEQYVTNDGAMFIGKGTLENVLDNETIRVDKAQTLTTAQKTQAQTNLGVTPTHLYKHELYGNSGDNDYRLVVISPSALSIADDYTRLSLALNKSYCSSGESVIGYYTDNNNTSMSVQYYLDGSSIMMESLTDASTIGEAYPNTDTVTQIM